MYILGNGNFAYELYEQIFVRDVNRIFSGFIIIKNDKPFVINEQGVYSFEHEPEASFVLGTHNKYWRQLFLAYFSEHYETTSKHFPNIIANDAHVSSFAKLGVGNIFCSYSLVNYNAILGNFNCINAHSTISSGCILGNNNILNPYTGIMDKCKVGSYNFFGAHSTVTPKLEIGNDNTVSAGECLFDDLQDREFFQSGIVFKKP